MPPHGGPDPRVDPSDPGGEEQHGEAVVKPSKVHLFCLVSMCAVLQQIRKFDSCQGKQASNNAILMWNEREDGAFSQPQEMDGAHAAVREL